MSREEVEQFNLLFSALNVIDGHLHTIMATQAEIVAQLNTISTALDAANNEITKVSGETSMLVKEVADLQAQIAAAGSDATPELVAAAQAVADRVATVASGVAAIDALVPDAPAP